MILCPIVIVKHKLRVLHKTGEQASLRTCPEPDEGASSTALRCGCGIKEIED